MKFYSRGALATEREKGAAKTAHTPEERTETANVSLPIVLAMSLNWVRVAMNKSDLTDSQSAPATDPFGHDYSQGFRSPEGYAVCGDCGARENTDKDARKCARLVLPMTENWEIARRMVEDRARAELRQELAAGPDDPSDEIIEGAEYWVLDPRLVLTPVLACVQDLQKSGIILFTIGSEERGYQVYTRRRYTFNLRRHLAAVIRSCRGATEREPGEPR